MYLSADGVRVAMRRGRPSCQPYFLLLFWRIDGGRVWRAGEDQLAGHSPQQPAGLDRATDPGATPVCSADRDRYDSQTPTTAWAARPRGARDRGCSGPADAVEGRHLERDRGRLPPTISNPGSYAEDGGLVVPLLEGRLLATISSARRRL